jgi:uncharacterized protein (DUF58 family)
LRPTRAGWVFFVLTFGIGFAALNTGNNLLYLILSLMLAFLVLSGVLSESALRGVSVTRRLPREIFAGQPALVALEVFNAQHRVPAFAIALEDQVLDAAGTERPRAAGRGFVLRVGPRQSERCVYRFLSMQRGEATFTGLRVSTRFPFGLFVKSLMLSWRDRVLVYPALEPGCGPRALGQARQPGDAVLGAGHGGAGVGGLRDFASGDSPRRIQWRASLRRGALVVRDIESERAAEVEVRLQTGGRSAGEAFEAAVRRAAAEAVGLLEAGARVALRTDGAFLESGVGLRQRARLLAFLARVAPEPDPGAGAS